MIGNPDIFLFFEDNHINIKSILANFNQHDFGLSDSTLANFIQQEENYNGKPNLRNRSNHFYTTPSRPNSTTQFSPHFNSQSSSLSFNLTTRRLSSNPTPLQLRPLATRLYPNQESSTEKNVSRNDSNLDLQIARKSARLHKKQTPKTNEM